MKTLLLAALLAITACSTAQDLTRTVSERRPGARSLTITGIFQGADSVYVQIYHDGKALHEDIYISTFTITLGTYDWYAIKFTDQQGRVKRLAIHELSDDLIEFYIPIEIDFDRIGNIVLIKPSHGKPDWLEFDVGMSKRTKR